MVTVYFDESGTHVQSPALAIGGCLATAEAWEGFQLEWKRVLTKDNIEYFHATDFECRKAQFEGWPNDRRQALQGELIKILKTFTQAIICVATHKTDYEKYRKQTWKRSVYYYSMTQAIYGVERWAAKTGYEGQIGYVFSQGAANGDLEQLRQDIQQNGALNRRLRLSSWSVKDMKDVNPLQAADIIAYETYKELDNHVLPDKELRKRRKSMELILTNSDVYDGYFCVDNFTESWNP